MSLLCGLTTDMWSDITRHMDCFSICWLYRTSKKVSRMLENGGVKTFSFAGIQVAVNTRFRVYLPTHFVTKLRKLRFLSLCPRHETYHGYSLTPIEFHEKLPQTLLSLSWKPLLKEKSTVDWSNIYPNLTRLECPVPGGRILGLPRGLTSLTISCATFYAHEGDSLHEAVFPDTLTELDVGEHGTEFLAREGSFGLPKNLTSFASLARSKNIEFDLSMLPRGLKKLVVPSWTLKEEHFAAGGLLPKFLEFLVCDAPHDLSLNIIYSLPPTLHTFLTIARISTAFYFFNATQRLEKVIQKSGTKEAPHLAYPLSLERPIAYSFSSYNYYYASNHYDMDTCAEIDTSTISFVPKNVISLAVSNLIPTLTASEAYASNPYTDIQLEELVPKWSWPPGLKKLIIERTDWRQAHAHRLSLILPSTLTYLHFSGPLMPDLILPDTLETLILGNPGQKKAPAASIQTMSRAIKQIYKWPSSLTTLHDYLGSHLRLYGALESDEKDEIGNIPPNLVNLIDNGEKRVYPSIARRLLELSAPNEENMDDNLISILRRDMHTLELPWNNIITSQGISSLPPSLTVLNLDWNYKAIDDQSAPLLPRTITKLYISRSTELSKDGVRSLPPNLVVLEWKNCPKFDSDCASLLPRTLTSLCISENPHLHSSLFKGLPRTLTKLEVNAMKSVENKDVAFLPRGMLHLNLNKVSNINREGYLNLPTEMKYLNIHSAQLKAIDFVLLSRIEDLQFSPHQKTTNLIEMVSGPRRHQFKGLVAESCDA